MNRPNPHPLLASIIALAAVSPAAAQISIGPRVGVNVNSLVFNKDVVAEGNRTGYSAGVQAELMDPSGLGIEIAAMYVRRGQNVPDIQDLRVMNTDYINIPVSLKLKLRAPLVTPYLFTGPSFAYRISDDVYQDIIKCRRSDIAWNAGVGVELLGSLQIGVSYGFGISKAVEYIFPAERADVYGKNRYWNISAAWMF